jgi:hypothetical protein
MLAAGISLGPLLDGAIAVLGAGCDGELTPGEVLGRVAALAAAGAWIGTSSVSRAIADDVERAAAATGTEASMQVVRCARGEVGQAEIRGGRRRVPLGPVGALAFCFDVEAAQPELPLAATVADAGDLIEAHEALEAIGVRTELDYERSVAGSSAAR